MAADHARTDAGAIADILSAIRRTVTHETAERYRRDASVARHEMMVLRPETRVDLLLREPDAQAAQAARGAPDTHTPARPTAPESGPGAASGASTPSADNDRVVQTNSRAIRAVVQDAVAAELASDRSGALRDLIRKIVLEELVRTGVIATRSHMPSPGAPMVAPVVAPAAPAAPDTPKSTQPGD